MMRRARRGNTRLAFVAVTSVSGGVIGRCAVSSFVCAQRAPQSVKVFHTCMVANRTDENTRVGQVEGDIHGRGKYSEFDYGSMVNSLDRDEEQALEERESSVESGVVEGVQEGGAVQEEEGYSRLIIAGVSLLVALTIGGVAAASGALDGDRLVALSEWFGTLGPAAGILYAGFYFLLELVGVPALPLTMGSGYLFGVFKGTVIVSLASTAAASASFLIARYGLRNSVAKLAARYPRFRSMDRAIGREGFKFVFLLRLSPLLPFAISNYLYGLTSVEFMSYFLGSWLGMLPGTVAYVSAGAAVGALTDLSEGKGGVNPYLLVIGLVATVAALSFIGKIATDAIDGDQEDEIAGQN